MDIYGALIWWNASARLPAYGMCGWLGVGGMVERLFEASTLRMVWVVGCWGAVERLFEASTLRYAWVVGCWWGWWNNCLWFPPCVGRMPKAIRRLG